MTLFEYKQLPYIQMILNDTYLWEQEKEVNKMKWDLTNKIFPQFNHQLMKTFQLRT